MYMKLVNIVIHMYILCTKYIIYHANMNHQWFLWHLWHFKWLFFGDLLLTVGVYTVKAFSSSGAGAGAGEVFGTVCQSPLYTLAYRKL